MQTVCVIKTACTNDTCFTLECLNRRLTSFLILIHHVIVRQHDNIDAKIFNECWRVF